MHEPDRCYTSADQDSGRWIGFPFRDGDIVISTRTKHGTTWMQMICALLVFRDPALPAPLGELSPWLDWLVIPKDQVYAMLEVQTHRRFIKTHTPLDGVPLDDRARTSSSRDIRSTPSYRSSTRATTSTSTVSAS